MLYQLVMHQPLAPHCPVCGPQAHGVFCALSGTHLAKLDAAKVVHHYQKGDRIFYEGNPAFGVFCVYSGHIKLSKTGPKDEPQTIRLLGPGEILGYRAVLAEEPYAATAEAIEPSTVCFISKDYLIEIVRSSPDLALRLLSQLARELRVSEEQALEISQEPVSRRAARLLIWLYESSPRAERHSNALTLPLLKSEMAQMIATTPETFSRVLRQLARRKLLRTTRWAIDILDLRGLKKIVNSNP